MQIFTQEELCRAAKAAPFSEYRIYAYERLDSTNAAALDLADAGEPEGAVVLADSQTAGRGRRGRDWFSPPGDSIFISFLVRPQVAADKVSQLTLAAAAAVREAIVDTIRLSAPEGSPDPADRYRIKWPNDIVAGGKKVCGILTEARMQGMRADAMVIGIGINVNASSYPEELAAAASSLFLEEGRPIDRQQLTLCLLRCFAEKYALFLQTGDLAGFVESYNACMAGAGQMVRVSGPGREMTGRAVGIDADGSLLLETEDGETVHVISGEVSLRGMNGYI